MHTIYKYVLDVEDEQQLPMPKGATILHVASVSDQVTLWALVDPDAPVVNRKFVIHGTGHDVTEPDQYVGTAITMNGRLVWHVFDRGEV